MRLLVSIRVCIKTAINCIERAYEINICWTSRFSAFLKRIKDAVGIWQQNETVNETPKLELSKDNQPVLNEPLMNEIEAARFLGISQMTLLTKRNANEIGFCRVGFHVLYSKENIFYHF